jgi:hypothetical protein
MTETLSTDQLQVILRDLQASAENRLRELEAEVASLRELIEQFRSAAQ